MFSVLFVLFVLFVLSVLSVVLFNSFYLFIYFFVYFLFNHIIFRESAELLDDVSDTVPPHRCPSSIPFRKSTPSELEDFHQQER